MRRPFLLPPGNGAGFIGGLAVPAELYWVAQDPAPLAGMSYPHRADWTLLHEVGLRHVVCLTDDEPRYDAAPLRVHGFGLQDLLVGEPADPVAEEAVVRDAAALVGRLLDAGEGVAVHCHAGRGRTGTVIGAALVTLGHDPDDVVAYLHRTQRVRNKRGWPEHPWQADLVRGTTS